MERRNLELEAWEWERKEKVVAERKCNVGSWVANILLSPALGFAHLSGFKCVPRKRGFPEYSTFRRKAEKARKDTKGNWFNGRFRGWVRF